MATGGRLLEEKEGAGCDGLIKEDKLAILQNYVAEGKSYSHKVSVQQRAGPQSLIREQETKTSARTKKEGERINE